MELSSYEYHIIYDAWTNGIILFDLTLGIAGNMHSFEQFTYCLLESCIATGICFTIEQQQTHQKSIDK
jgi:hypothetical protein